MQFKSIGYAMLAAFVVGGGIASAQPQPAAQAARTVVAAAKLPSVVDKPMNFRVSNIELKSGDKETLPGVTSVLYQVSGSSDVSAGGQMMSLTAGTGFYIPAGSSATVMGKGDGASVSMLFQLAAAGDQTAESGPATVKEMFRTTEPLPGLKAGVYDLNLTRVTFPAGMPSNAPHHRTGGALYYVISGTGANTIAGTTYQRTPGVFIYEPAGLVHQWGNPGPDPLTFVTLNINQEGVGAVAPETPPKP